MDKREVRGGFDGGTITSDAGGLRLRAVEKRTGIITPFAACFRDHRKAERIEPRVEELVAQRVYGLALGYEDLNDRAELRRDPLHGNQEGRFFHGSYGCSCSLPLYISCGEPRLCARRRPANIDGATGSVEEVARRVKQPREAWPGVRIIGRGDSGFWREELLAWCEANPVDYVLGLAKNERLRAEIAAELAQAAEPYQQTGQAARIFKEFTYQTRQSWSRARRVVAKAEPLDKGANPRLVVTSLASEEWAAQAWYEELSCARGEMENRIKEQRMLFADRTSTAYLRSNQIRLYFSSVAYVRMQALRRRGRQGTEMAKAQGTTLRLKRLKIGALIRITGGKVWVSLAGGYPYGERFRQV